MKSTTDLFVLLVKSGYRYCKPASRAWSSALIRRQGESVLCILFRKNGIDLRFYESYKGGIVVNSKNVASISGGDLYRNHYNESSNYIVMKVAAVALSFSKGVIREELCTHDGRSYKLNPRYPCIRDKSREEFQLASERMQDLADRGALGTRRSDFGVRLFLGDAWAGQS